MCAVVAVLAEEGHSSQYIHKHDDHQVKVEFKDKHGHHEHDYYVGTIVNYAVGPVPKFCIAVSWCLPT